MPSFWNWLCFPQRRLSKQQSKNKFCNHGNGKYKSNEEFMSSMQKRKLLDLNNDRNEMDDDMVHGALRKTSQEMQNSVQRLQDGSRSNKRRRVQDIFSQETDNHVESLHGRNSYFCDNENANNIVFSSYSPFSNKQKKGHYEFGSGYTPGIYKLQNGHRHQPVESMYAYTPKIVQNVYASTALEGNKIDDFFGQLHEERSMSRFASINDNQKSLETSLSSTLSCHPVPSHTSADNEDKLSLIEHDVNGNQTVVEWNDNLQTVVEWHENIQNQTFQAPFTQHMTEMNFEKVWGSGDDGEVLY